MDHIYGDLCELIRFFVVHAILVFRILIFYVFVLWFFVAVWPKIAAIVSIMCGFLSTIQARISLWLEKSGPTDNSKCTWICYKIQYIALMKAQYISWLRTKICFSFTATLFVWRFLKINHSLGVGYIAESPTTRALLSYEFAIISN